MNHSGSLVAVVMLTLSALAATADTFVVAKLVNRADETEFRVMSPAELKALQLEISNETRVHAKALALARDAWIAEGTNTRAFPANAIGRRSASSAGMPYEDEERANEKCARAQERLVEKAAAETEKERARVLARTGKEKFKEKYKDYQDEAAAKRALEDKARALYEQHLATLTGNATAPNP